MKNVRLNIEDDFLLRSANLFSKESKNNTDVIRPVNHIHFVICNL